MTSHLDLTKYLSKEDDGKEVYTGRVNHTENLMEKRQGGCESWTGN